MTVQILSLGYERRSIDEFLSILASHHVVKLIDIRELPLSRRKGFSKNALATALEKVGIEYRHLRVAGNPHRKEKADLEQCLSLYGSYLQANPVVIDTVAAELSEETTAILCYEREHEHCHRSVLLSALQKRGLVVNVVKDK